MANVVTSALFVAFMVGLIVWLGPRQPQWASRDGRRFIAMACAADIGEGRPGRWIRAHGRITSDGIRLRQGFMAARTLSGTYREVQREESADHRFAIFTLGSLHRVHVKVPANGPLAAVLTDMITDSTDPD